MDEALRATALMVRTAMPCSVTLPAGTGKTHIVAGLAALAAERGERVLILTHTNAGVDVMRRRLRQFGVNRSFVRVDTIASWSFDLIRHYPLLSGTRVGLEPDWADSHAYYEGAEKAARAAAIQRFLRASYDLVIVDEYQDCVIEQHALIVAIAGSLPTCVFGDPLQNIFNFGDNVTVKWSSDVVATWPALELPVHPWRWDGYNNALGQWLIEIRDSLLAGQPIDMRGSPLIWRANDSTQSAVVNACFSKSKEDGRVVVIGKWEPECAKIASRTNGTYGMMEELEGKLMMEFAAVIDSGDPVLIASQTLTFARKCISGVAAKLDKPIADKLAKGQPIAHLRRAGADEQVQLLARLQSDASPPHVIEVLTSIGKIEGVCLYRREAWRDMLRALSIVAANGEVSASQAVTRIRNRARILGRTAEQRIISRPLLIKGLEYDHAIVFNADRYTATELYVALTRGRKSLTVISNSRYLNPARPEI